MKTYAVYQTTPQGTVRLGTFRGPAGSVRKVSQAFAKRHPHADMKTIAFASRYRVMGTWADGARVPADLP